MYKTLVGYNLEEVQSLLKVFLLDIQIPVGNSARLPIKYTAADVALFAQMKGRLAMLIHVCQLLIIHLLRKISTLTLKCITKTFYFVSACYTNWKRVIKCIRKQQLGADLACTFIECCLLMNKVFQFHASFPSR